MASARMLEGHSSKNPHRPREKGAECEVAVRKSILAFLMTTASDAALILRHTRACVTVSCPSVVCAGEYVRRTRQAKPSKPQREE